MSRLFSGLGLAFALCLAVPASYAAEPAALLPEDSVVVIRLHLQQMMNSPLAKSDPKTFDNAMAEIAKLVSPFGIDAKKDLKQITLMANLNLPQGFVGLLEGNFDPAAIQTKMADLAKDPKNTIKMSKEGALTVFETPIPAAITAQAPAFPPTALMAVLDKEKIAFAMDKQALANLAAQAAGKKVKLDGRLVEQVGKIDANSSVAIAFVPPAELMATMDEPFKSLTMVTGGLTLTDGVVTQFRLGSKDAATAKDLADKLNEALGSARALLPNAAKGAGVDETSINYLVNTIGTLKATADGAGVKLESKLTPDMLKSFGKKGN